MAVSTRYAKGQWRACCDVCGKVFKSSQLLLRWDGARVCAETCFELRNAQELLRMPRAENAIPWSRNCEAGCGCSACQTGTRVLDSKLNDRISLG